MNDWKEGDLVEAVKGETVIRGRLISRGNGLVLNLTLAIASDIPHLEANGYTLTRVEHVKSELPTEPGVYEDREGDAWLLAANCEWHCLTVDLRHVGKPIEFDPSLYAPFTRIEPVPVTAKKVLDRVSQILPGPFPNEFSGLAREFGVQS